ncbi:GIY-YIG nuclease family protein [Larsenimonas suaedae]|uniref:Excinuclease cho n=1 Tax=Larsenimonas suaedae TaxID=1851019 RepID=A0ABU1GVA5_9GAMM|nr:GIY-YIG nuclease family protein [Larsenimonas suaedae]MCM2971275.1 GIY-YIG nuclease family protein [Larsenimonas suaedae]MDR5895984.1 GIY-YIG nuclease family protein [Larsenimonas suaedae]
MTETLSPGTEPQTTFIHFETSGPRPSRDRITRLCAQTHSSSGTALWQQSVSKGHEQRAVDDLIAWCSSSRLVVLDARRWLAFLKRAAPHAMSTARHTIGLKRLYSALDIGHEPLSPLGAADLQNAWQALVDRAGNAMVDQQIEMQLRSRSLPAHVSPAEWHHIPHHPGVYLFYGHNDVLLYIGKSVDLKTRIASHFTGALQDDRTLKMTQQIEHIEYRLTGGDFSAQLIESTLIKARAPLFNRKLRRAKTLFSWHWNRGQTRPALSTERHSDSDGAYYGLFRRKRDAIDAMTELTRNNALCPKLMGLESGKGRCFAYQIGRCRGACQGIEPLEHHDERAEAALGAWRLTAWPWEGPVAIFEGDDTQRGHVFDHWCYLGQVGESAAVTSAPFDVDIYHLLNRFLLKPALRQTLTIVPLDEL